MLDEAASVVVESFHQCPNLSAIVEALQSVGVSGLRTACVMRPGVPVQPMLAKITNGVPDCIEQLACDAFLAEYKYDGQRAQIHVLENGQVCVFLRGCFQSCLKGLVRGFVPAKLSSSH